MGQKAICRYCSQNVHQEVDDAPVAPVFHLADVFQKIIQRLYSCLFPYQYLVHHINQLILHILPQPRNQLDALPV
jgi:hypothetical protein